MLPDVKRTIDAAAAGDDIDTVRGFLGIQNPIVREYAEELLDKLLAKRKSGRE